MVDKRRIFGNAAESDAAAFLIDLGYKIIAKQYTHRFGEIDLIAIDGKEYVMVEVKARQTSQFGYPEEAVTKQKLRKIAIVGQSYMDHLPKSEWRIDVIAIEYNFSPPKITHLIGVG